MTTYELPPEPQGPVWDKEGNKWERVNEHYWETDAAAHTWTTLLRYYGPLSDVPPVKVGDTITVKDLAALPEGSVAATSTSAYIAGIGDVRVTGRLLPIQYTEIATLNATVLRIGDGSLS